MPNSLRYRADSFVTGAPGAPPQGVEAIFGEGDVPHVEGSEAELLEGREALGVAEAPRACPGPARPSIEAEEELAVVDDRPGIAELVGPEVAEDVEVIPPRDEGGEVLLRPCGHHRLVLGGFCFVR